MKPGSPVHRVYACFNSFEEFKEKAIHAVASLRRYLKETPDRKNTCEVVFKIEQDFKSYTEADQQHLLDAIQSVLNTDGDVGITRTRRGSVLVTLELSKENALCLIDA